MITYCFALQVGIDRQAFSISQKAISDYKLYCVTKTMLCTCGLLWLYTTSSPRANEIIFLLGGYATAKSKSKGSFRTSSTSHRAGPRNKTVPSCRLQLSSSSQERLLLSLTATAHKWDVLSERQQSQALFAYSHGCLHPFNTSSVGGLSPLCFFIVSTPSSFCRSSTITFIILTAIRQPD